MKYIICSISNEYLFYGFHDKVRRDGALLVDSKSGSPIKPIPNTVVSDPFRTSYPAFQVGTGGPFPGKD